MTDNAWDRSDPRIGLFVTRIRVHDGAPLTLPHRVDSTVTDEPFTRCGRRLRKREGTDFRFEGTPARRVCAGCSGG